MKKTLLSYYIILPYFFLYIPSLHAQTCSDYLTHLTPNEGLSQGYVSVVFQKQQKRLLPQKVIEKIAEIKKQTVEFEQLNRTKDQFFAIIAHDLRSPVIAFQEISKLIDFFLKKNQPEKIKELGERFE